jgi:hypothetical protein
MEKPKTLYLLIFIRKQWLFCYDPGFLLINQAVQFCRQLLIVYPDHAALDLIGLPFLPNTRNDAQIGIVCAFRIIEILVNQMAFICPYP